MRRVLSPLPALLAVTLLGLLLLPGCTDRGGTAGKKGGGEPETEPEPTPTSRDISGPPPSLVLVSIDTLRSDRLSVYDPDEVEAPAFELLARDGVLFERAYTTAPLTLPAHASLFTGLEPPDHGVRDNLGYRLGELPTVARSLTEAGYATGGAVSAYVLRGETGIGAGFDAWDDGIEATSETPLGELDRPGEETLRKALEWLDRAPRPFFLFLHLFEPHTPYDPPPRFAERYPPYEGEVAEADRILGLLLDELTDRGLYDETAVIVLSDHGEGLGDHGEKEHGILLHRETLQIPLLVKLPDGEAPGLGISRPVSLIDVAPTLLELAGIPISGLPGRSLLENLRGEATSPRALYAETYHPRLRYGWSELLSGIRGSLHLIHGPSPELYDLERDPGERDNVIQEHRSAYQELREVLRSRAKPPDEPFEEDSETRRALASLGYLGGGAGPSEGPLPDPRSRIHQVEAFREAVRAVQGSRYERAVSILEPAVKENPRWIDAWQFLGLARSRLGREEEAFAAYERAFELSGGSPLLAKPLARLALELERPEDALVFLRLAAEQEPEEPVLRHLQARTLLLLNRPGEALEPARTAVDVDPRNADSHYFLGLAHLALGNLDEAEARLRRTLELRPGHPAARHQLETLLTAEGRHEEAEALTSPRE